MSALEFTFHGLEVGYFEEASYPKGDGSFRYMPYRGPGHFEMARALREVGEAVIAFEDAGVRWSATAKKSDYGVLILSCFSALSADAAQKNA